jgi:hydroxylamine reductase
MFCYQCQEAANGTGCTGKIGVCGVSDEVIDLQDLFVFAMKGLAYYSVKAREKGIENEKVNHFIFSGLFMTITNANFDDDVFEAKIKETFVLRDEMRVIAENAGATFEENLHESITWSATSREEFLTKAAIVGNKIDAPNEDVRSLRALILYGVKGMAAYAEHAYNLGYNDTAVFAFMQKALLALTDDNMSADELVALVLETGKYGVDVMALLDTANTSSYGNPEITSVKTGVRNNPSILISGHDLSDLKQLLDQTQGTGVDVYTHSEMLPAHYYPEFKKYENFVGNYGNAWWQQNEEFESFNGPILFTTNCIVPPRKTNNYSNRVFTTGASGFPEFKHIEGEAGKKDFSEIIELAKKCEAPTQIEDGEIVGGFAHNQVLALADKVVDAVKTGAIKKFFVMAGCDGRQKSRSYYSDFAAELPQDTVVLTAGCAKYRYNKLNLGDIGGIPRVLDAGQCNDSYSLAVIAMKLKEVFELEDINELPIAYNIAWYEQKAVIVLLALLHLGVKNIHLGPTLPAFLSPNVAKVLVETFGIGGITDVKADIEMFMNPEPVSAV